MARRRSRRSCPPAKHDERRERQFHTRSCATAPARPETPCRPRGAGRVAGRGGTSDRLEQRARRMAGGLDRRRRGCRDAAARELRAARPAARGLASGAARAACAGAQAHPRTQPLQHRAAVSQRRGGVPAAARALLRRRPGTGAREPALAEAARSARRPRSRTGRAREPRRRHHRGVRRRARLAAVALAGASLAATHRGRRGRASAGILGGPVATADGRRSSCDAGPPAARLAEDTAAVVGQARGLRRHRCRLRRQHARVVAARRRRR